MFLNKRQVQLEAIRCREHERCIICGRDNGKGLHVQFRACEDGSVSSLFSCSSILQGYGGHLHGGEITSLLDGAMTNCLFAQGKKALTGELNVRFLHPVDTNSDVNIRAWITASRSSMHKLEATMVQNGRLVAKAKAKFMEFS